MRTRKFAGLFILALMTVFIFAVSAFADIVDTDSPYHVSKWKLYEYTGIGSIFSDWPYGNFGSNCFQFARLVTNRLKNVDFYRQANNMRAIDPSSITGNYKIIAQRLGAITSQQMKDAFANVKEGDVVQLLRKNSEGEAKQHTLIVVKVYGDFFTTLEANWQQSGSQGYITNEKKNFKNLASDISGLGSDGGFTIYRFGEEIVRPSIKDYPNITAIAGVPFSYQCTATGSNVRWATDVNGSTYVLPGLSINSSTGLISGTPSHTSQGKKSYNPITYMPMIIAENSTGYSYKAGKIYVYEPPVITTSSPLPNGKQDTYYSQNIRAEGTEYSMVWELKSGSLPPGLKFNGPQSRRTATISGTPTQPGTYVFTIELSNLVGNPETTTTKTFQIKIDGPDIQPDPSINIRYTFRNAKFGENYSDYVIVELDKYSWSQSFGNLPPGLNLTRSSKYIYLRGKPTTLGTYNFAITIYKTVNNKWTQKSFPFTVSVTSPYSTEQRDSSMSTTWNYLPGKIGTSYYDYIRVNGGVAPYNARVISGTAPTGLTLSTSGSYIYLRGIPRGQWKNFTFTLRITGAHGGYVDKNCSLNIAYNPAYPVGDDSEESLTKPKIISKSLVDATVDAEYSAILETTGATPITL